MLARRDSFIETIDEIGNRRIDQIVGEKDTEQSRGDLDQDALAAAELFVAGPPARNIRIGLDAQSAYLRAQDVRDPGADLLQVLAEHSYSVLPSASLKSAFNRNSTLFCSLLELAWVTSMLSKSPDCSSALFT